MKQQSELLAKNSKCFSSILTKLTQILFLSGNQGQSLATEKLAGLLEKKEFTDFIKLINSVDMWGGSGAVWEVYIEDKGVEMEFETQIIALINLMEETNILGKGIKPIRSLFQKHLNL